MERSSLSLLKQEEEEFFQQDGAPPPFSNCDELLQMKVSQPSRSPDVKPFPAY
jgi:hypothetical protein